MVNQSDIQILTRFIPALVQKHHELQFNNLRSDQIHLKSLFSGLNAINTKRQAYIKANAPYFNIFDIMRYGHYETRLHTPFLVHLLSPDGHHQLENLFLKLFIDKIFSNTFDFAGLKDIEVYEEFQSSGLDGRIDIFLKFRYKQESFFAAIENKIDANDQPHQLTRYYDFLRMQSSRPSHHRLIYLTKYGDKPSIPYSIDEGNYNSLSKAGVLILFSYRSDISCLIKQILQGKNPQPVNEILNQYLKTLNNF